MSRIEIELSEYQGMRKKIKNLESALNSVSLDAAKNKEKIEQVRAIVEDLKNESFLRRAFKFKDVLEPINTLLNPNNENIEEKTN